MAALNGIVGKRVHQAVQIQPGQYQDDTCYQKHAQQDQAEPQRHSYLGWAGWRATIFLEFVEQSLLADSQNLSSASSVAFGVVERKFYQRPLSLFNGGTDRQMQLIIRRGRRTHRV